MIPAPFAISGKTRYAVDLSSLTAEPSGINGGYVWADIRAVWFRRKNRVTAACIGHLRDLQTPAPKDAAEFLAKATDGRYGGRCEGRWDGTRYWGAQEPETIEAHLALLRPMLDSYPEIPEGFDGWYVYEQ